MGTAVRGGSCLRCLPTIGPLLSLLCCRCPRVSYRSIEEEADDDEDEKERSERVELSALLSRSSSATSSALSSPSSHRATPASFSSSLHGTLNNESVISFERLVFRISRGNAILHLFPIDSPLHDPVQDHPVQKTAFVLVYVGEELEKRLKKCIAVVGGTEYELPGGSKERLRLSAELRERRSESMRVLRKTEEEIRDQLATLAWDEREASSPWWNWQVSLQRERGVCETLRRCDQSERSRMLLCEGWVQSDHLSELQVVLAAAVAHTSLQQAALQILPTPPSLSPPTHFPTNKFTSSFQAIVDTYGVPRYKEVNPGLFTLISFPFLFGVMYGDIGHGTLLTLSALLLLYHERSLALQERRGQMNEILSMVFGGRYLMLLMGAFAVYCGLVYNDCFSIPIPLFPSAFHFTEAQHRGGHVEVSKRGSYPFGVDWRWYGASNELAFFNSLKMKASVLIGVTQMTFGILLSAANDRFFHDLPALYLEFVPRLLFLTCTFGYMCALILYKWTIDWTQPHAPPQVNLIQTMINMFLQPGHVDADHRLYWGQGAVQGALLAVALLSVPVMLLGVPWVEQREHKRKAKEEEEREEEEEEEHLHATAHHGVALTLDDASTQASHRRRKGNGTAAHTHSARSKRKPKKRGAYETVAANSDDDIDDDADDEKQPPEDDEKHPQHHPASLNHPHALLPLSVDHALHNKHSAASSSSASAADASQATAVSGAASYSFSDRLIAQSIHTIEFVLGCVSNTASYLRLWALSLAHAQLAGVFWSKMIMQYGLTAGGEGRHSSATSVLMSVIGVAVWAGATFAVLLCMDVLECFLHALRLHWVEFQNKFYHADGYPFEPFGFRKVVTPV